MQQARAGSQQQALQGRLLQLLLHCMHYRQCCRHMMACCQHDSTACQASSSGVRACLLCACRQHKQQALVTTREAECMSGGSIFTAVLRVAHRTHAVRHDEHGRRPTAAAAVTGAAALGQVQPCLQQLAMAGDGQHAPSELWRVLGACALNMAAVPREGAVHGLPRQRWGAVCSRAAARVSSELHVMGCFGWHAAWGWMGRRRAGAAVVCRTCQHRSCGCQHRQARGPGHAQRLLDRL